MGFFPQLLGTWVVSSFGHENLVMSIFVDISLSAFWMVSFLIVTLKVAFLGGKILKTSGIYVARLFMGLEST